MPSAEDLAYKAIVTAQEDALKPLAGCTSTITLKVGDEVVWVTVRSNRRGFRLSAREGVILRINLGYARVRDHRSKKQVPLPLDELQLKRPKGGPITDMLYALAGKPVPEHLRAPSEETVPRGTPSPT